MYNFLKEIIRNKVVAERSRSDNLVSQDTNSRSLSGVETNGICQQPFG